MLATEHRLRTHTAITHTKKNARRFYGAHGVCFLFLKTKKTQQSKVVVILGKKFSRKAVVRNRQRRILQAAAREIIKRLPQGLHLIMRCKNDGTMVSYKDAVADCEAFIKKVQSKF